MFPQKVKIEELEKTKGFYDRKLKDKRLTEKQKNSFLWALQSINKLIEKEKRPKNDKKRGFIRYELISKSGM